MSDSFCRDSEQIQGESIRFCYQLVSGAQWVHRVAEKEKVIRYTSSLLYLKSPTITADAKAYYIANQKL